MARTMIVLALILSALLASRSCGTSALDARKADLEETMSMLAEAKANASNTDAAYVIDRAIVSAASERAAIERAIRR